MPSIKDAKDPKHPKGAEKRRFIKDGIENFKLTLRGLRLAWETSPPLGFAICGLTLVSACLSPAMAYAAKLIIDAVVSGSARQTITFVCLEFVLISLSSLVQRALFFTRSLLGMRLGVEVNSKILYQTTHVPLAKMEDSEFYDKMNRARMEASNRSLSLVTDAFQFIQNALTLLGYVSLLVSYNVWAVVAMVLASVPATVAEMRFSQIGFRLYNWRSPERRKMAYMEYVLANDTHAKEIRAFGLGPHFFSRFRALAYQFYEEGRDLGKRRTAWSILLSVLSSSAFYACYLLIALSAARKEISLGSLTLYVLVFRQGQQAFQSCLTALGGMYEHNLYLSNLFDFLAIPIAGPTPLRSAAFVLAPHQTGIAIAGLGFRYPGRDAWAIENVNLYIPPGQSVALIGSNGAGKSTLIKLLCGLYQPTVGHIWIDGKEIHNWEAKDLNRRMTIVFQDYNKYQLNVEENIGVGKVDSLSEQELILRAAGHGGVQEFLGELPDGLKTPLGSWFNGGRELSGGQWQKVASSRAFMREDADILILDEPTAALDPEAESLVFQRFHELTKGKTSVIISHRFPVARLADHIVVMDKGKIVEEGSHRELMDLDGRYAKLFNLQAQGYSA